VVKASISPRATPKPETRNPKDLSTSRPLDPKPQTPNLNPTLPYPKP